MCGIAGYFGSRVVGPATVERMLSALRQRGPDAEAVQRWDASLRATSLAAPNALLNTRLAIIDPRPEADPPIANDAGDIWVAYNGEVYDWSADAEALKRQGFCFRTRSDTEFILHAYEHWGIDFVSRLRGMFAIAICDIRRRAVFVIRDRFGLKPIVYARRPEGFAFASTVRALLPWLPSDARGFSPSGFDAYLAHRTIPAPRTAFANIARLPPAHYLRFDLATGDTAIVEYWRPVPSPERWQPAFDDAIRMRTVADRPLGLFLSSGVDSSAIACRLAALGFGSLQTFTAAFSGTSFDESADAERTARKLGLSNRTIPMDIRITEDFARIIADLDEPFADPSCLPTWYLSRETTRHVKVVLGGDGGDELFAGYKRYAKHLRTGWRHRLQMSRARAPAGIGGNAWRRLIEELRLDWASAYVLRFSGFTPGERLFLSPGHDVRAHYWRMPSTAASVSVETLLEIDRLNYLPDYILRKADLCTMAHGLEMRAPFLDHHFAQSVMALSPATRFTKPAKALLAPVLEPLGSDNPLTRSKRGFNPPIDGWLKTDIAFRLEGLGERLQAVTSAHLSGQRIDAYVGAWARGEKRIGEQVLQLVVLDESLAQLAALARIDCHE
ncbi:MAG: asparagine synthase (glutamine-hydrolyzing) [Pseudomonadota bacterium]|nr:asparagine synthase (glutamine-hydrolyzing) [Pseudomonadota bacterium]